MPPWRRIIAFLLILVFVPASLLAAGTLKLCFGADGHRAVETVMMPHDHGRPDFAVFHPDDPARTTLSAASNTDCYDVELADTVQRPTPASWERNDREPSKVFGSFPARSSLILSGPAFCGLVYSRPAEAEVMTRDPHLASLATIVLLN